MFSKTTKKVLSFVLAMVMVFGLVQVGSSQKALAGTVNYGLIGPDGIIRINAGATGSYSKTYEQYWTPGYIIPQVISGWIPETGFMTGGGVEMFNTVGTLNLDLVDAGDLAKVAPVGVYESKMYRDSWTGSELTFSFSGLTEPLYTVRLHFAVEDTNNASEDGCAKIFSYNINGTVDNIDFSDYKGLVDPGELALGNVYALIKEYSPIATAAGNITISFTSSGLRTSISGIELIPIFTVPDDIALLSTAIA